MYDTLINSDGTTTNENKMTTTTTMTPRREGKRIHVASDKYWDIILYIILPQSY